MASSPSEFNLVTLDQLPALTDPLADTSLFYVLQFDSVNSVYEEEANKVTLGTVSNYFKKDFGTAVNYNAGTSPNEVLLIPASGTVPDDLISDTFAKSTDLSAHIDNKSNPHTVTYQQVIANIASGGGLSASWQGGIIFNNDRTWKEEIYPTYRSVQYGSNEGNYYTWVCKADVIAMYANVDNVENGFYVRDSGPSIEGKPVTIVAPTNDNHAATKKYVDDAISTSEISHNKIINYTDNMNFDYASDGIDPCYIIQTNADKTVDWNFTNMPDINIFSYTVAIKNSGNTEISITFPKAENVITKISANKTAFCRFEKYPASFMVSNLNLLSRVDIV